MDQILTNKKFIEQMDTVITKLGGTPVDLELTEDQEDDMVLNGVFASKIDEVIKALGGTPAEISVAENNMVSNAAFQVKMEDVVKNMESGGGGGDSDFSIAKITFVTHSTSALPVMFGAVLGDDLWYGEGLYADVEINVPLYKGTAYMPCGVVDKLNIATTGGVVWNSENEWFIVTGDGTITITDANEGTQ